jgi:hypothetical protein
LASPVGADLSSYAKPTKKSSGSLVWFIWWKVDKDELTKQVKEYNSLSIWRSARKISALLLLFSAAVTVILYYFLIGIVLH